MKNASNQVFGACWWCLDRFDWLKIFYLWLNILLQNTVKCQKKKKNQREREREVKTKKRERKEFLVLCNVRMVPSNMRKNKGTTKCDKSTVICDIGTAQCEAGTIKYEEKK